MRLFKSATWPSIWLVHGSFSLSALLALETRLAGELADRYVRMAVYRKCHFETLRLDHPSHAIPGAKLMPAVRQPGGRYSSRVHLRLD
jgi:hypothetical protein